MTAVAAPEARAGDAATKGRHGGFRADVEGLRAVAIGLVLIYHAGVPFLPGGFVGVDVFFVVSGFLITGLLVREVERSGTVSMTRFYARRAKRLLPAAALVLGVSALLTWLTGPVVDWRAFGHDIVAAALYVENWQLAARSVDYLAEGTGASPVQHFWSLSVEEQFYIVWPLLLLVVALVARRTRIAPRPLMAVGLTLIVVPSLVWSVVATQASPASAFFVTPTRLWELGVGGLIAIGAGLAPRIPPLVARVIGVLGLVTVVASALFLDHTVPWPGAAALLPVLGTGAVLLAGTAHLDSAPRVLGLRPAVWIGGLSYSLYLWHWPLLIAAENVLGELTTLEGLAVVAVSVVPAWLSLRFVENPVRFSARLARSDRATLVTGAGLTACGVVVGLLLAYAAPAQPAATGAAPGAAALRASDGTVTAPEVVDSVDSMVPSALDATEDLPVPYDDGCDVSLEEVEPQLCVYGDPEGDRTVVLAGDSKALQWFTPVEKVARERGWRLVLATKSACGFSDTIRELSEGVRYEDCGTYNKALTAELLRMRPDAVIVSQRHSTAFDPAGELTQEAMVGGLVSAWSRLQEAGTAVVPILDNPSPAGLAVGGSDVYACVAELPDSLGECSFERAPAAAASGAVALSAAAERAGITPVRVDDLLCGDRCPAVIGGVLVYRQGSHVTDTYAASTAPFLQERLAPLVEGR